MDMRVKISLDVGIGDFKLSIAFQYEEETQILICQVEDGVIVLADCAQVVLLDEEVDN